MRIMPAPDRDVVESANGRLAAEICVREVQLADQNTGRIVASRNLVFWWTLWS